MTLTKEFFNATMKNTGLDQESVIAFMQDSQKGHNSRMKSTVFMQDAPKGRNSRMKSTYKRASSMHSVHDMSV